jgi:hypothetical protein
MCPPMVIGAIGLAANIAGQFATFSAQSAAASAQIDAYNAATVSAGESLANQISQENIRLQQEYAAGVEKQIDLRREAAQVRGTILAASDGGQGLSEELLLNNVSRDQARYNDIIAVNMRNQSQQSYWNKQGMVSEAQSRSNANRPTSGGPSVLGLAAGIAGAGVGYYDSMRINRVSGDIPSRNPGSIGYGWTYRPGR